MAIIYLTMIFYKNKKVLNKSIKSSDKRYELFRTKLEKLTSDDDHVHNYTYSPDIRNSIDIWHIVNPNTTYFIFFCSGNYGNITYRYNLIKFWYQYASIVIFDYPNYGRSYGNLPIDEVTIKVWNYCMSIYKFNQKYSIIFGETLGCFGAVKLVLQMETKPNLLVLHLPIYDINKYVQSHFKKYNLYYPFYINKRYNLKKIINQLSGIETIVVYSSEDELNSEKEIKHLYNQISGDKKKLIRIKGKSNDLIINNDYLYSIIEHLQ
jgi:hypothetical protein